MAGGIGGRCEAPSLPREAGADDAARLAWRDECDDTGGVRFVDDDASVVAASRSSSCLRADTRGKERWVSRVSGVAEVPGDSVPAARSAMRVLRCLRVWERRCCCVRSTR